METKKRNPHPLPPDFATLHRLSQAGEGQFLEFKLKANHPDKLVKEMVAFANAGGGLLLVGVADDGQIKGVKHPEEEAFTLEGALHKYADPLPEYSFNMLNVGDQRAVVCFRIVAGEQKPYQWLHEPAQKKGRPYLRYEDKSVQASREWRKVLKLRENQKELTLSYGNTEQRIVQAFQKHDILHFRQLRKISKLPAKKLSYALVGLTYCNVLKMTPTEEGDHYEMIALPDELGQKTS